MKCHAGIEIPDGRACPKCGADAKGVCWPGINADLAALPALVKALEFYSDPRRYEGANQRPIENDTFQPDSLVYRLDVTRDLGSIARAALAAYRSKP